MIENFFKKVNKLNKGFTLVETLVALSIFSMSVIAMMSILGSGISDTGYAKKKIIASYLAQEGIEYIRNMRDNYVLYSTVSGLDWNNFKSELVSCNEDVNEGDNKECGFTTNSPIVISKCTADPSICKIYLNNGNYNTNSNGEDTGFTRKIWMDVIEADKELKISSSVTWTQGSGKQSITFSENLFNWVE